MVVTSLATSRSVQISMADLVNIVTFIGKVLWKDLRKFLMEKDDYDLLVYDLAFAIAVDLPTARKIIDEAKKGNLKILRYYGFDDLENLKKRVGGISRYEKLY
jgi:hypothetical protein